ncbi:hypothetical protein PHISCL_09116 [Aspergillus sclerotialis]|uniref:Uncharacterized protein n=1 Tax=Aspergillus sclerotialis TaxID=2070753 RepID=A0A3A2ZKY5_9EURO|nr:hypothetical protein PHISCL_09116 [Aspergillus sclerotialis]
MYIAQFDQMVITRKGQPRIRQPVKRETGVDPASKRKAYILFGDQNRQPGSEPAEKWTLELQPLRNRARNPLEQLLGHPGASEMTASEAQQSLWASQRNYDYINVLPPKEDKTNVQRVHDAEIRDTRNNILNAGKDYVYTNRRYRAFLLVDKNNKDNHVLPDEPNRKAVRILCGYDAQDISAYRGKSMPATLIFHEGMMYNCLMDAVKRKMDGLTKTLKDSYWHRKDKENNTILKGRRSLAECERDASHGIVSKTPTTPRLASNGLTDDAKESCPTRQGQRRESLLIILMATVLLLCSACATGA